MKTQWQNNWLM